MKKFNRVEAAEYCGVSTITIDRALAKNLIGHFKIGRRIIMAQEHLDEFLRNCERKPLESKPREFKQNDC